MFGSCDWWEKGDSIVAETDSLDGTYKKGDTLGKHETSPLWEIAKGMNADVAGTRGGKHPTAPRLSMKGPNVTLKTVYDQQQIKHGPNAPQQASQPSSK